MHETCSVYMAVGPPTAGERKLVSNQHKLFALNIIVIIDFLFPKHFFYAKNKDKIACFCLFSCTSRTGIFSFATENITKFLLNRVFLLLYWMLKFQVIINSGNHCFVEVLPLDLRSWQNWKVIVPIGTIFTAAGPKGLKEPTHIYRKE